jgi:hypothetical protein
MGVAHDFESGMRASTKSNSYSSLLVEILFSICLSLSLSQERKNRK